MRTARQFICPYFFFIIDLSSSSVVAYRAPEDARITVQNPYSDHEAREISEHDDMVFEVGLDLSDEDAEELLDEFRRLDPSAVKRDLANATWELQRLNWERWSR